MQKLGADQRALFVHRITDGAQRRGFGSIVHTRATRFQQPLVIRRKPAGDNHCHLATRAFSVKCGLLGDRISLRFQPRVHRPHDNAIAQFKGSNAQRRQQIIERVRSLMVRFHSDLPLRLASLSNIC